MLTNITNMKLLKERIGKINSLINEALNDVDDIKKEYDNEDIYSLLDTLKELDNQVMKINIMADKEFKIVEDNSDVNFISIQKHNDVVKFWKRMFEEERKKIEEVDRIINPY